MEKQNKSGAPKKSPTVTPGLRIDKKLWSETQAKYPRQINKMFNEWLKSL